VEKISGGKSKIKKLVKLHPGPFLCAEGRTNSTQAPLVDPPIPL